MYPNYPGQQNPGYPPYPDQGFPPQQPGYPGQGFPPQQQPGYPPMPQGYPPAGYGMPNQQVPGAGAYPPQGMPGGAYPPQPNYPPAAGGYAPQYQYQQAPQVAQQVNYQQQYAAQPTMVPQQPRPTVFAAPNFDASNDAAKLRKAMKGFGTDEDAIIEVLCRRTNAQRMEICRAFKTGYGKDLISDIKSECGNNFLNLLLALLTPLTEFYCAEIHDAMAGTGTDEETLIEIFCALPNHQIHAINHCYASMYGQSLESELKGEASGCFKRLLVSMVNGNRDESMMTDANQAMQDAQVLKDAGVGRMGTDESEFNRILCSRSFAQLKLVAQEYERMTGHTLEKDIKKEFSGDIEDGMVAILRCAINRAEYFAKRLHNAMSGIGTDDRALIRLVATRCEIDMADIKDAYQQKYGKSLKSMIQGDTSGDYKHALYVLIGEKKS